MIYIAGLERDDCHATIRDSFALVNTSDSEGMALAILEVCLEYFITCILFTYMYLGWIAALRNKNNSNNNDKK